MKDLYIFGTGGFAKEIYFLAKSIGKWNIKGFLDIEEKGPIVISAAPIPCFTQSILTEVDNQNTCLALGIGGSVDVIARIFSRYGSEFDFPNLVHPNVIGNFEDINMGSGNIITAGNIFTTSIKIGSFNIFNLACTIGHDVIIGDGNIFNPCVNISGGVTIGNSCFVGVNATILQYKTLGDQAVVGASSLVTKDVDKKITVVGIPAKKFEKK